MKTITAVAGVSALFLSQCSPVRVPPSVVSSGNFSSLEEKFDQFVNGDPPMNSMIVALTEPDDFIQFSQGNGEVEIDLPLFSERQKGLESEFRKICADLGLTVTEFTDPEGNRFLDADVPSDPAELSRISQVFLTRLFDANENSGLNFTLHPNPR